MTDIAVTDQARSDATVRMAAGGDAVAFSRLVAAHHGSMARVAFVITGDVELAQDAVQSAWAIAWRRLGGLRDADQVRTWLVAIAANEARQLMRRQRRHVVVDLSLADTVTDARRDPADMIDLVDLERALRRLKPDDRAMLALRYVAGLDSTEIAAHMGGTASGVRTRLARTLGRLRSDLDHD